MLIFGESREGSPSDNACELYYEDGRQYSGRGFGRVPERQWDLSIAIKIANANPERGGETLLVVDPETRAAVAGPAHGRGERPPAPDRSRPGGPARLLGAMRREGHLMAGALTVRNSEACLVCGAAPVFSLEADGPGEYLTCEPHLGQTVMELFSRGLASGWLKVHDAGPR